MEWHHVDVNPDPAFHFDAYPALDSDPDLYPNFHTFRKKNNFLTLFTALLVYIVFIFLVIVVGIIIFNILDSILNFSVESSV